MWEWSDKMKKVAMVVLVLSVLGCSDAGTSRSTAPEVVGSEFAPKQSVKPAVTYDRVSQNYVFSASGLYQETVTCPSGDKLASGGFQTTSGAKNVNFVGSFPVVGQVAWEVDVEVTQAAGMVVYAVCST